MMKNNLNEEQSSQYFNSQYNVECPLHKGNYLANICVSDGCVEPLCPECVSTHIDSHYQLGTIAKIETLTNKRKETLRNLNELIFQFQNEKKKLARHSDQQRNEIAQHYFNKIEKAKAKVHKIIDSYFETLVKEVKKDMDDHASKHPGEFKHLNMRVDSIITGLEKQLQNLNSSNYIKPMLKFQHAAVNQDYANLKRQIDDAIEIYLSDIKKVVIDESKLYSLNVELNKFIYLKENKENEIFGVNKNDDKYSLIEKAFAHDITNDLYNISKFSNINENSPKKITSNVSNYNFSESKIREYGKGKDDLWKEKLTQNFSFYFPNSVHKY